MSDRSDLDAHFGPRPSETPLGMVVGGSLSEGLTVKLDPRLTIEKLAVGRYVVIQGKTGRRFFGLITDIALDAANPDLVRRPPPAAEIGYPVVLKIASPDILHKSDIGGVRVNLQNPEQVQVVLHRPERA